MLAALVLEKSTVLLADTATVSFTRPARSSSMFPILLWKIIKGIGGDHSRLMILAGLDFLLLIATTIAQFTSILLISDISVSLITGPPLISVLPCGLRYSSFANINDVPS